MRIVSIVRSHKRLTIAGAAVLVAASGIGTAFADSPAGGGSVVASNGTITGCYPNEGTLKNLYLIDTSAGGTCPRGFTEIAFNQTGHASFRPLESR